MQSWRSSRQSTGPALIGGGLNKSHMKELRNGLGKVVIIWLRWLVTDLSHLRPGFDPWLVHVEFVMGKIALGQVFLSVLFSFVSSIPPMLHTFHLATTNFFYIILANDSTVKQNTTLFKMGDVNQLVIPRNAISSDTCFMFSILRNVEHYNETGPSTNRKVRTHPQQSNVQES